MLHELIIEYCDKYFPELNRSEWVYNTYGPNEYYWTLKLDKYTFKSYKYSKSIETNEHFTFRGFSDNFSFIGGIEISIDVYNDDLDMTFSLIKDSIEKEKLVLNTINEFKENVRIKGRFRGTYRDKKINKLLDE